MEKFIELQKKFEANYQECVEQWKSLSPHELIENSFLISTTKNVRTVLLLYIFSPEEIEYFMSAKKPLEQIVKIVIEQEPKRLFDKYGDQIEVATERLSSRKK